MAVRLENVEAMVGALGDPALAQNKTIAAGLRRLVPALTRGSAALCAPLARYLAERLCLAELDKPDCAPELKDAVEARTAADGAA